MINLGVLVSGYGANLQAIIDSCSSGNIKGQVKVVISDRATAFALERAKKAGVDAIYLNPKDYANRNTYELEIVKILQQHKIDLVCLAGYMRLITEVLLSNYPNKILNIHPALLPSFPGLHAAKQALEHGAKVAGATVHFVDGGCDTGPIILQSAVPVLDNDTEDALSARILEQELIIYSKAIKLFSEAKLKIEGRRVIIS